MSRLLPRGAVAAAAAAALLAGCGVDTKEAGRSAATSTSAAPATTSAPAPAPSDPKGSITKLPQRGDDTIALATQESAFTDKILGDFAAAARDVQVTSTRVVEGNAYAELCSGRSDVVQTSIAPSAADERACAARGLRIADPVQLGSDAVVLATRNQSDVGGDCLSVRQARDIFRDGSPYDNWSELGFDDLPLRTAGREDGSDNFEFFGLQTLGLADPTLGSVRSDFTVRTTDSAERRLVTGVDALAAANRRADRYAARERRRRTRNVDAEQLRLNPARNAAAAKGAARTYDAALNRKLARFRNRELEKARRNGYIGHFSFSYYELFEAVLRPMEIDFGIPETSSGQPVRFGDLSAADQRRLAPAVRAGLARQAGRPVADPGSGATGSVADIGETTTLPNIDGLPAETGDGREISTGPNCVFPSQLTVTTGAYPLTRRIFYVTTERGLERPAVRALLTFALDRVQAQAGGARVVPITDQQRRDAYIAVTGKPPGDQPDQVGPGTTGGTGTSGATGQGTVESGTGSTAGSGTTGSATPVPTRPAIPGVGR